MNVNLLVDFYQKVVAYKKKGIKVSIAIGGWNDSLGDKYSRLVNDPAARRRFIENLIQFIEKYDFDGLDLDWEYPKCWQVRCKDLRHSLSRSTNEKLVNATDSFTGELQPGTRIRQGGLRFAGP